MTSTRTETPPLLLDPSGKTSAPGRFGASRLLVPAAIALSLLAAAILFFFDPHHSHIYPVCIFHQFTGLNCPGCGSLRGLHALLHGHVIAALHANALLMLTLPLLGWLAWRFFIRTWRGPSTAPVNIRPVWLWVWLVAMTVFTVLRNFPAFAWLSP